MKTLLTKECFDEFYNVLFDIEERESSWIDDEYAEKIAEKKLTYHLMQKNKKNEYKLSDDMKNRELDLRRKLLHNIGKYELEEGEVFEQMYISVCII